MATAPLSCAQCSTGREWGKAKRYGSSARSLVYYSVDVAPMIAPMTVNVTT